MSFVLNRWVRGQDFFGRAEILERLRTRGHKPTWILGNRRSGKTSLLRQIEWLCAQGAWGDTQTLFWDLQGAGSAEGLKESLLESLEDAPKVAKRLNLDPDELESLELSELLSRFRRKIKGYEGERLLLLVDECEELVDLLAQDPSIQGGLRKLVSASERFCMVLAGSVRLMDLDESALRTSPFLPDFIPPLPLLPLSEMETLQLLAHHGLDTERARQIHALTFGNPHLTQVLGEAWMRLGTRDLAYAEMEQARVTRYFFDSNFTCLVEDLRHAWRSDPKALLLQWADLKRDDPNYLYLLQSSLIRTEDQEIRINPLLLRLVMGSEKMLVTKRATPPEPLSNPFEHAPTPPEPSILTPPTQVPESSTAAFQDAMFKWRERLVEWQHPLLPTNPIQSDGARITPFASQIHLPSEELHALLDRATPEYLSNQPLGASTKVYLFGLALLQELGQPAPFRQLNAPLDRAEALLRAAPKLVPGPEMSADKRRALIVALRCLQPKAAMRYESLESAFQDLQA